MQQTEFAIRRELILKGEELSTSDDPLEAYLERRGWKLERVRELRESIVVKLQPKLFEEDDKLSREEETLQQHIQDWLDMQTKGE